MLGYFNFHEALNRDEYDELDLQKSQREKILREEHDSHRRRQTETFYEINFLKDVVFPILKSGNFITLKNAILSIMENSKIIRMQYYDEEIIEENSNLKFEVSVIENGIRYRFDLLNDVILPCCFQYDLNTLIDILEQIENSMEEES